MSNQQSGMPTEPTKPCPACRGSGRQKLALRENGIHRGFRDVGVCQTCGGKKVVLASSTVRPMVVVITVSGNDYD